MRHRKKAIERPGLVGPKGEMLVIDTDPMSESTVYKIDEGTSSEVGRYKRWKGHRRRKIETASKMYKRAKKHFVAFR